MNLQNKIIGFIQKYLNLFLDKIKKKAYTKDEFLCMYAVYYKKISKVGPPDKSIDDIRRELEFSNFTEGELIQMFSEYQSLGYLTKGNMTVRDYIQIFDKYTNTGSYTLTSVEMSQEYLPALTLEGREYVSKTVKELRWNKYKKRANIFSFLISIISSIFILLKLYLWIFKGESPL